MGRLLCKKLGPKDEIARTRVGEIAQVTGRAGQDRGIGQSTAILPQGCLEVFRLDKTAEGTRIKLILDGQLSGDCVAVIETCCDEAMGDGKGVELVLHECAERR